MKLRSWSLCVPFAVALLAKPGEALCTASQRLPETDRDESGVGAHRPAPTLQTAGTPNPTGGPH